MKGWECPKCGRVFAPHVQECLGCNPKVVEWTPYYPEVKPYIGTPLAPYQGPWWGILPPHGWPDQSPYGGYLVTCNN